jgi:hypothetical protein
LFIGTKCGIISIWVYNIIKRRRQREKTKGFKQESTYLCEEQQKEVYDSFRRLIINTDYYMCINHSQCTQTEKIIIG